MGCFCLAWASFVEEVEPVEVGDIAVAAFVFELAVAVAASWP